MLVRKPSTKEIKLAAIFIDPWKDIDFDHEFDCSENIFEFKHSDIKLPLGNEISCLSSGSQIKRIYLKYLPYNL